LTDSVTFCCRLAKRALTTAAAEGIIEVVGGVVLIIAAGAVSLFGAGDTVTIGGTTAAGSADELDADAALSTVVAVDINELQLRSDARDSASAIALCLPSTLWTLTSLKLYITAAHR